MTTLRVGLGYDLHRLAEGRPLVLGGVNVPFERGPVGHSDGDVLLHALIDALLGACGLPDIGEQFPDDDPAYRDADSSTLLATVLSLVRATGFEPHNVDCVIHAERPKLGPYKPVIRQRLASLLGLSVEGVSVKAKTGEGVGAIGNSAAIAASVVVSVRTRPVTQADQ